MNPKPEVIEVKDSIANATQEDIAISAIVARVKAMWEEEGSDQ